MELAKCTENREKEVLSDLKKSPVKEIEPPVKSELEQQPQEVEKSTLTLVK
jgi:hypothetical protein